MKTLSMYPHKTDDKATIYLIFRKHAKHTIILLRNDCIYGIFLHVSAIKYTIKWHKAVQCASTCNLWFPIRREVATCVPLVFWKSWTGRFICKKSLNKCKMSLWLFTDKIWLKIMCLSMTPKWYIVDCTKNDLQILVKWEVFGLVYG